jgi:hypothetical protein
MLQLLGARHHSMHILDVSRFTCTVSLALHLAAPFHPLITPPSRHTSRSFAPRSLALWVWLGCPCHVALAHLHLHSLACACPFAHLRLPSRSLAPSLCCADMLRLPSRSLPPARALSFAGGSNSFLQLRLRLRLRLWLRLNLCCTVNSKQIRGLLQQAHVFRRAFLHSRHLVSNVESSSNSRLRLCRLWPLPLRWPLCWWVWHLLLR